MKTLIEIRKLLHLYFVRCSCFLGFHKWKQYNEKHMKTLKNSTMYYYKCEECGCTDENFIMW